MKVAVIGAGFWGKKHVSEYKKLGAEVIVCDPRSECGEFCRQESLNLVSDYKQLLKDDSVKAASICTPNDTHVKIASDFLNAGKSVLLEKPMALDSKGAKKLVSLAKKKKAVFTVGHIFRYNNALEKARQLIESGELGELYYIKLNWLNLDQVYEDRDIFFDLALHPIDVINLLLGNNPEEVFAIAELYRKKKGEEICFVSGRRGKTLFSLDVSWLTPEKTRTVSIICSKKSLFIDCLSQKIRVVENSTMQGSEIPVAANNPLSDELKGFLESAENHSLPKVSAEKGLEIIRVIEAIRESMKKRKPVKLKKR